MCGLLYVIFIVVPETIFPKRNLLILGEYSLRHLDGLNFPASAK